MRNSREARIAGMLTLLLGSMTPLLPAPEALATAVGLVRFESPVRVFDTRVGSPVTTRALGSHKIVQLALLTASGLDGQALTTATVHPCSQSAPSGDASLVLRPDAGAVSMKVILGSTPTCLTASLPLHVIMDQVGTILSSPAAGGPAIRRHHAGGRA